MVCGLPVVVSDVPANLEWIQDSYNGFVVPRKDSGILAKKIIRFSKDKKIRQKFDDRNLKITRERTDINENFKNLEAMYKELVVIDDN